MIVKALGITWRDSKNMADSSRAPIKDALKVITTEQDTLGAAVGT